MLVDLRNKTIQVHHNRSRRDKFIVYFKDKRMVEASKLDLHFNATRHAFTEKSGENR